MSATSNISAILRLRPFCGFIESNPFKPQFSWDMKTKRSSVLAPRFIRMVRQAIQFRGKRNAFTFVELLVVLAVLAVMVSLVATALAGSRPNFQGALCLNNMRQLMAAFTMYTHDNADIFPPNPDA